MKQNKRKPVRGINLENNEIIEFKSMWQAGKYVKERAETVRKKGIDGYCNNIKRSAMSNTLKAYGYKWEYVEEGSDK